MPRRSRWLPAVCVTVVLLAGWSPSRSGPKPGQAIGPGMEFRKTGRVVLELGGPGTFDECNAKYPCVLRVGDEWWMYYSIGHLVDVRDRRRVRTSLAIHKFR